MPITDINSYVSTTAEFEANWLAADSELNPNPPIMLAGNYDRFAFIDDRSALLTLIENTRIAQEAEREAYFDLANRKIALMTRGKQFRGAVLSKITDTDILKDVKAVPAFNDQPALFIEPFRAAARLWARINAGAAELGLTGPLTLAGGYALAQFNSDIALFASSSDLTSGTAESAAVSKGIRTNAMKGIYERMKQYRAAAPAYLPANSPVLASLPRLSPEPGTTPPGLVVTGTYDAVTGEAVLSFAASTAKNILKLQARGCVGTVYKADEETVIGDLAPDATGYRTNWGLSAPGSKVVIKVYVMTTTGNQNGGKAVRIVRPVVE